MQYLDGEWTGDHESKAADVVSQNITKQKHLFERPKIVRVTKEQTFKNF